MENLPYKVAAVIAFFHLESSTTYPHEPAWIDWMESFYTSDMAQK
jgi:hypothetical protein